MQFRTPRESVANASNRCHIAYIYFYTNFFCILMFLKTKLSAILAPLFSRCYFRTAFLAPLFSHCHFDLSFRTAFFAQPFAQLILKLFSSIFAPPQRPPFLDQLFLHVKILLFRKCTILFTHRHSCTCNFRTANFVLLYLRIKTFLKHLSYLRTASSLHRLFCTINVA